MTQDANAAAASPVAAEAPGVLIPIAKIFCHTGDVPEYTYVPPLETDQVMEKLSTEKVALFVDGPSGFGKTTTLVKCLENMTHQKFAGSIIRCTSPRFQAELENLELDISRHLPEQESRKYYLLDDFHRLDFINRSRISNLIKSLADTGRTNIKIVLISIMTFEELIEKDHPDLSWRVESISITLQNKKLLSKMVTLGEKAGNILFDAKDTITDEARGSFALAQWLCFEAARLDGVKESQPAVRRIKTAPSSLIFSLMEELHKRFRRRTMELAALGMPDTRGAGVALIWQLARSTNREVSIIALKKLYPQNVRGLNELCIHLEAYCRNANGLISFNNFSGVCRIDDFRFQFYLCNLIWNEFISQSSLEGFISGWDHDHGPIYAAEESMIGDEKGGNTPMVVAVKNKTRVSPLVSHHILHLSDLHFSQKGQAELWFDQLAEDLQRELRCPKLEGLILSGDITNTASETEYTIAQEFVSRLKKEFQLNPDHIIIVPGNHDIHWPSSERAYEVRRRSDDKKYSPEKCIEQGQLLEVRNDKKYQKRFFNFGKFHEAITGSKYPEACEEQAIIVHFPMLKLLILGLNSAWEIDHHYKDRASINATALSRALAKIRTNSAYENTAKMAVWHHPLNSKESSRITDHAFVDRLAVSEFRVALHGHIHTADNGLFFYDRNPEGRRIDIIAAGTFGAPLREWVPGYPLQYNLLCLEGDKLIVETRRREAVNGAWKPDARWLQGQGKDPIPRYEISALRLGGAS